MSKVIEELIENSKLSKVFSKIDESFKLQLIVVAASIKASE